MSETINVDHAFNPELRKSQEDLNVYLENRPNQDLAGTAHDPSTGRYIKSDDYFNEQRESHYNSSQTAYEDMSMLELSRELAMAEIQEDRTSTENITDALLDKMADHSAKMTRKDLDEGEADDLLWNRIMNYKDGVKAKATASAIPESTLTPEPTPEPTPNTDTNTKASGDTEPVIEWWKTPLKPASPTVTSTPAKAETEANGKQVKVLNGLNAKDFISPLTDYNKNKAAQEAAANTDSSAETANNEVKLDVAYAEQNAEGMNLNLRNDDLKLYGIFKGEGASGATVSSILSRNVEEAFENAQGHDFSSVETALNVMKRGFNQALAACSDIEDGYADGAIIKMATINGETYALIGNAGDNRVYLDTADNKMHELGDDDESRDADTDVYYEAFKVNKNDRIIIASANTSEEYADLRTVFKQEEVRDAPHKMLELAQNDDDKAAMVIDVEEAPGSIAPQPVAAQATGNTEPHATTPEDETKEDNATEEHELVTPTGNELEVVSQPKKLRWRDRAKLAALNAYLGMSSKPEKNGYSNRKKIVTAAVGVLGVYVAYKGGDSIIDAMNGSDAGTSAPNKPAIIEETPGTKVLTQDEIEEAIKEQKLEEARRQP